jgi:hypothetical protein
VAPSLAALLLFRVVQGAGGGGLQPMAQAILADSFPPQHRGLAFALYGVTTIIAPTLGPTLGGWITFKRLVRITVHDDVGSHGMGEAEVHQLVDTVDNDRAAFVEKYFTFDGQTGRCITPCSIRRWASRS